MGCPHVQAPYTYQIPANAGSMLPTKYPHMRAPYGHKIPACAGYRPHRLPARAGFIHVPSSRMSGQHWGHECPHVRASHPFPYPQVRALAVMSCPHMRARVWCVIARRCGKFVGPVLPACAGVCCMSRARMCRHCMARVARTCGQLGVLCCPHMRAKSGHLRYCPHVRVLNDCPFGV